jgi:hypothetical protein
MKRSVYSPCSASILCSSWPVPSVVVTIAWVSPRVNSTEPCTRGSSVGRIEIGRTVRVLRPSMRGSPLRIWPRTILDSMSFRIERATLASAGLSSTSTQVSHTFFLISSRRVERSDLDFMR